MWKTEINNEMFFGLILTLGAFLLAMFLTPIYTYFAYKYKFWKKQKKRLSKAKQILKMKLMQQNMLLK